MAATVMAKMLLEVLAVSVAFQKMALAVVAETVAMAAMENL